MSSSLALSGARRLAASASSASRLPLASTSSLPTTRRAAVLVQRTHAAPASQRWNSTTLPSVAARASKEAAQFMEDQGVPVPSHLSAMDHLLDGAAGSAGGVDSAASEAPERAGYAPHEVPPRKDPVLELFTNLLMVHGRKAEAERRMGEVLQLLRSSTHKDPIPLVHAAVELASPTIRMTTLRKSSKNVPLPSALDARQRARQGIVWILKAAERGRGGGLTPRSLRIAKEVVAVLDGSSSALQRKEEVHRLGAVNRSNLTTRL